MVLFTSSRIRRPSIHSKLNGANASCSLRDDVSGRASGKIAIHLKAGANCAELSHPGGHIADSSYEDFLDYTSDTFQKAVGNNSVFPGCPAARAPGAYSTWFEPTTDICGSDLKEPKGLESCNNEAGSDAVNVWANYPITVSGEKSRAPASYRGEPAQHANTPKVKVTRRASRRKAASLDGGNVSRRNGFREHILQTQYLDVAELFYFEEELGRGMSGAVRRCVDRKSKVPWACKSISKASLRCHLDADALVTEVQAMSIMSSHPAVVGFRGVFEDSENVHLVMELCEGGDLFDRIKQRKRYPEKDAAAVCRAVASVLADCHQRGIMHRDLKPENILLASADSHVDIRVADFGTAALNCKPGVKLTQMVGSALYMAPCVLHQHYGLEADLWSLGVILHILLCGVPPFWGPTNSEIFKRIQEGAFDLTKGPWRRVSEGAKDLVRRLLTTDTARQISAEEVMIHPWILEHCPDQAPRRPPTQTTPLNPAARDALPTHRGHHRQTLASGHCPSFSDREDEPREDTRSQHNGQVQAVHLSVRDLYPARTPSLGSSTPFSSHASLSSLASRCPTGASLLNEVGSGCETTSTLDGDLTETDASDEDRVSKVCYLPCKQMDGTGQDYFGIPGAKRREERSRRRLSLCFDIGRSSLSSPPTGDNRGGLTSDAPRKLKSVLTRSPTPYSPSTDFGSESDEEEEVQLASVSSTNLELPAPLVFPRMDVDGHPTTKGGIHCTMPAVSAALPASIAIR